VDRRPRRRPVRRHDRRRHAALLPGDGPPDHRCLPATAASPSSLSSPSPPPASLPLPESLTAEYSSGDPSSSYPPALPSPSFEFRSGFDDDGYDQEQDGFDDEHYGDDGQDHDDHDCTCSSPHSTCLSSSSSTMSGDAADTQLVNSLFGVLSDQVGELKMANEELRDTIDNLWQTLSNRLDREEEKVSALHQMVSTRLVPADAPPQQAAGESTAGTGAAAVAGEPINIAQEVFRELPFLLEWADSIDFANPDGFVIDDMGYAFRPRNSHGPPGLELTLLPSFFPLRHSSKPFIVRRLFEPSLELVRHTTLISRLRSAHPEPRLCSSRTLSRSASTRAPRSAASHALLRYAPSPLSSSWVPVQSHPSHGSDFLLYAQHEIVGTLCYKAQEEPLRWYLARKCPRPVGDICFLPLVRPIGDRLVQSLTKNQIFYDANGNVRPFPIKQANNRV
jgi:hypothetical protein